MGFVAFTVACAVAPTLPALLVFRFFQGAFGSCGVTNAGASIADMVRPEQRGTYLAGVSAGTLIGPIIGPVIAGFLTEAKGWRWVFWLVTILSGVMAVPLLLLLVLDLGETYQPVLLQRKVNRLRKHTGNPNLRSKLDDGLLPAERLRHGIVRPVKLLIKSPISIVCALYLALVYGYLYLMFSSVVIVFQQHYGITGELSGLVFLGLGLGNLIGMIATSWSTDRAIKKLTAAGSKVKPEVRLGLTPIGGLFLPAGLFIYGVLHPFVMFSSSHSNSWSKDYSRPLQTSSGNMRSINLANNRNSGLPSTMFTGSYPFLG